MRRFLLAVLLAATCAVPGVAEADAARGGEREARALFEQGVELAKAGRLREAVDAFERSRLLVERPSTLQNLAVALEGLGRITEALQHVARTLELRTPDDPARPAVEALELRLAAQLARLTVHVEPAGAAVWVDERIVETPLEQLPLDPGSHTLRASLAGHESVSRTLSLVRGQTHSEQLVLVPSTAPEPPSTGEPLVSAPSPAEVPARAPSRLSGWAWGTLAGGTLAAGGAVTSYVFAGKRRDSWRARCPDGICTDPGEVAQAEREVARLDRTSQALFGVSGALAVAAGTLGILWQREQRNAPQVSVGPLSIWVRGRF